MKKYNVSPQVILILAAFVVIDGSVRSLIGALCALWHELWHIIVLGIRGGGVRSLKAKGIGLQLSSSMLGYVDEAMVCAAGPVASLFAAVVCFFLRGCEFANIAMCANLTLFFVNALPIYPLDGGRFLRCVIARYKDDFFAAKIIKAVSVIFLLPLSCLSVIIFIESGFNLTLLIICVYLAIGVVSL